MNPILKTATGLESMKLQKFDTTKLCTGQKSPARGKQRQSKTFLKDEFIAKALWMRRKKAFGKVFASPSG
ncbi:MAG: hypothetical protein AAF443_07505, partial [Chlamydiota bacterium]